MKGGAEEGDAGLRPMRKKPAALSMRWRPRQQTVDLEEGQMKAAALCGEWWCDSAGGRGATEEMEGRPEKRDLAEKRRRQWARWKRRMAGEG